MAETNASFARSGMSYETKSANGLIEVLIERTDQLQKLWLASENSSRRQQRSDRIADLRLPTKRKRVRNAVCRAMMGETDESEVLLVARDDKEQSGGSIVVEYGYETIRLRVDRQNRSERVVVRSRFECCSTRLWSIRSELVIKEKRRRNDEPI